MIHYLAQFQKDPFSHSSFITNETLIHQVSEKTIHSLLKKMIFLHPRRTLFILYSQTLTTIHTLQSFNLNYQQQHTRTEQHKAKSRKDRSKRIAEAKKTQIREEEDRRNTSPEPGLFRLRGLGLLM